MMKIRSKVLLIVFLIFLILSTFHQNYTSAKVDEVRWGDIEDKENAFVFKVELISFRDKEYLLADEFLLNERICGLHFKILNFPANVSSISFTIILKNQSEIKVYDYKNEATKNTSFNITIGPNVKLNESGLWFLELIFTIYATESISSPDSSVGVYRGENDELNKDSDIRKVGAWPLDSSFSLPPIEISVYTMGEYAQIRAARAAEEAAFQQSKSAKASEKLLSWQRIAVTITFIAAIATALMAIYTKKLAKYTKQANEEFQKERKKPGIMAMIAFAINPSISEFKKLKEVVEKIKEGYISDLPSALKVSDLDKSYWKDFRKDFKNLFKKVQKYLEDREKYTERLEKTITKIKEILKIKKETIEGLEDFLEEMTVKYKCKFGAGAFFNSIASSLAKDILYQEYAGTNYYSKKVFEKFKEEWLKIREEEPIREEIVTLIEMGDKFDNYIKLIDELEEERNKLMKDYDIKYTDIKLYEQETFIKK